jgi:hypothetical protein
MKDGERGEGKVDRISLSVRGGDGMGLVDSEGREVGVIWDTKDANFARKSWNSYVSSQATIRELVGILEKRLKVLNPKGVPGGYPTEHQSEYMEIRNALVRGKWATKEGRG